MPTADINKHTGQVSYPGLPKPTGKGSSPRPVKYKQYEQNWNNINWKHVSNNNKEHVYKKRQK